MKTKYPERVTTDELAELLAGGDDYIRTKLNEPVGLALNSKLNPDAPEVVVIGSGSRIILRAQRLFESNLVVPVYIKLETNCWNYTGQYRAVRLSHNEKDIEKYGQSRIPGSVSGILFLERCDTDDVTIQAGGFANAVTKKAVEQAAVKFVWGRLEQEKYVVTDCQSLNLGYDLKAVRKAEVLLVEVKGTDFPVPRFYISRNEASCANKEKNWRMYVVTQARDKPRLFIYNNESMRTDFHFDPLSWLCTRKGE